MLYKTVYRVECYHKHGGEYLSVFGGEYNVRAVSVHHAINKMLSIISRMPGYSDRANDPDWEVIAEVSSVSPYRVR